MGAGGKQRVRRRALSVHQNEKHPLYLFSITGDELLAIADISRNSPDDPAKLLGYQRPEVKRHVQDIVEYLNGDNVIFPNSIVLALSSAARFTSSRGPGVDDGLAAAGVLEIPLPVGGQPKPGWVVAGHRRVLAISKCGRRDFPIPISAFVADEVELQRDQFQRVNNTHPLPQGLITELLPEVSINLSPRLAARYVPAAIRDWLNRTPTSPFFGLIRGPASNSTAKSTAGVADTAIVKMIEDSLSSPSGCLFTFRNIASGETDMDGICAVLVAYWTAVQKVFPDAWGKSPEKSRLMHGAGIRAMGRLMDRVMSWVNCRDPQATEYAQRELLHVAPVCRWTEGVWDELDDLAWNEVQNTSRHLRLLSNYLIRYYLKVKGMGQ
ncbi:MAG TPA: DGQHR domain-containing protein DpdB [Gemmataceae bacterium]|nr:DGQHR domain-containing protein DpdB [Gemmataceae bacterium]